MATKKRIIFITNPISGTHNKEYIPELIEKALDKNLFDYQVIFTEYAGHAAILAKNAVKDHIDIVVAVGGDGTINEIARSLVHTETALGIIPCGSGNGLARHLMIPMEPEKAIEIINQCEIHDLDYGIINGLPFFCTCGMGFDAFVSMKFAMSGKRGPTTYIENVLKEGLKYKPETYEVIDETGTMKYKAFLIACANASQYGNNAFIAPQASMTDGLMDVIIMEPFNVIEAPQISIQLFNKTLDKSSKIKTFKSKKIHIHRSGPGVIHFDGDPIMTSADIDVEMVSKGIKIIVNPKSHEFKMEREDINPFLNAFSDFFNDINSVKEDIAKTGHRIQIVNKVLLRRLTKK
jgi:YegS/Rv2252/BmrU family lipid kinase